MAIKCHASYTNRRWDNTANSLTVANIVIPSPYSLVVVESCIGNIAGGWSYMRFDGVDMTLAGYGAGYVSTGMWYRFNHNVGTYNLTVGLGSNNAASLNVAVYTGVHKVAPINDTDAVTDSGLTLVTTVSGCWLVAGGMGPDGNQLPAGYTVRGSNYNNDGGALVDSASGKPAGSNAVAIYTAGRTGYYQGLAIRPEPDISGKPLLFGGGVTIG